MSVKLSAYVWDGCALSGMKLSEVVIMARLADWCNDEGVCWPSVATIARQIGAGESTVRNAIGKLVKDGWLSRRQRRQGNRNASNVYQLNVSKLRAAASQVHPPESDTSESDASKFEASKSDPSKSQRENGFDPLKSGGDPLVNSKQEPSDKNTIGQPPSAADQGEVISQEIHVTDQAILVLKYLNTLTGAKYTTAKATLQNIRGRLVDGNSLEDLNLVVEYLVDRWLGTEWAKYLNPETMFRPGKFPGNLLAAQAWNNAGRKSERDQQATDHTERDAAYRRFIGSGRPLRNPSQLEEMVKAEASRANVRSMNASFAVSRWNSIWKDCAQRTSGSNAA